MPHMSKLLECYQCQYVCVCLLFSPLFLTLLFFLLSRERSSRHSPPVRPIVKRPYLYVHWAPQPPAHASHLIHQSVMSLTFPLWPSLLMAPSTPFLQVLILQLPSSVANAFSTEPPVSGLPASPVLLP